MKIRQSALRATVIFSAVIALVAAGYVIFGRSHQSGSIPRAAVTPISPDAQAAVAGVSAFYTIDYTETQDQWAERVCQRQATDVDCFMTKALIAPTMYTLAQENKVQTTCSVYPIRLVADDVTNEGWMIRTWELQVTLSDPWPNSGSPMTVFVDVVQDPTNQTWSMRHVLFDQEAQALQTAAP